MPDIAGHEVEPVVQRGRRDLKIRVGQDPSLAREAGVNLSERAGDGSIVRQHRDSDQHSAVDVLEMPLALGRSTGSLEQLSDHDRTRELIRAGDGGQPAEVRRRRLALKNFRNRVGVE